MNTADIEQLQQDIPVQLQMVVPSRTVQEPVAAGAGCGCSQLQRLNLLGLSESEHILQEHVLKHGKTSIN